MAAACTRKFPVSDSTSASSAAPSNKKRITLWIALVLAAAGAASWWFFQQQAAQQPQEEASKIASFAAPPAFLPLDSMVVNLADSGGERFAQVGITLEIAHAAVADQIKPWLPQIRSSILLLLSQRTSDELLTRAGKEQLALDIRRAALRPLGYSVAKDADPDDEANQPYAPHLPVRQVLFSSFIVQ